MLTLYDLILFCLLVLAGPLYIPVLLKNKNRRISVPARLGITRFPSKRPAGGKKPIWIHALSVGELYSAMAIVDGLKSAGVDRPLVVSTSTQAGYQEAQKRLGHEVEELIFFPLDLIIVVRKFLSGIDPCLVIMTESDIWPCFLNQCKHRNIPVILANGRLSPGSFRGYRAASALWFPFVNIFDKVCAQTDREAGRFLQVGVDSPKIQVTGNLKFDQKIPEVSEPEAGTLRKSLEISQDRKVLIAGSTHSGEERILSQAFSGLKAAFSDMAFIVVPRDPMRGDEVAELFAKTGWRVCLALNKPDPEADIFVINKIGYLARLYALSDAAFVGGSLVNFGGHNLLEPAAHAKPIFFGPHMQDFPAISQMLLAQKAAIEVKSGDHLALMVSDILSDPHEAKRMGKAANRILVENRGAVEKTIGVIKDYLCD